MLSKFQKGDRVKVIKDFSGESKYIGEVGTVVNVFSFGEDPVLVEFPDGMLLEGVDAEFSLLDSVKNIEVAGKRNMGALQKLTILAKTLVDSDLKTLLKAGWLNSSLELTVEGEDAIFAHYLTTHKADLAKLAKAEMKENRKGRDDDDEDEKKG